ncbi:MAG TPA: hypothetical protein VFS20_13610 [Longimicrobium sp.]|nr:hypothetical protein [Longimicrobium sp.]
MGHRLRRSRLFSPACAALLLLACLPAATRAQAPPGNAAAARPLGADTVPVVLTISGGISLGSHQSGVNWALVNFFRHSYHDPAFRQAYGVNPHRLAVATGASAGNVNAVLSSLDWCAEYHPRSDPAEQSLMWALWTGMGIHALFPNDAEARRPPRRDDPHATFGVFRRDSIRTLYSTRIGERFRDTANSECRVALGVTLTRVHPDSVRLNPQIHPRAQRFASMFTIRTRPGGPGERRLEVVAVPPAVRRHPAFGKLALPPADQNGSVAFDDVIPVVEASSAFPLVFEPVDVPFYEADSLPPDGYCPPSPDGGCAPARTARFMDNNPLSLAIELFRHTGSGGRGAERYIYINPDRTRRRQAELRTLPPDTTRAAGQGLAAIGGLLGGAVPAARQYELHSLARALNDTLRGQISVTDRGHLLVSSRLGAFAGFLGRPFREFDFYVGIYDGLHYAASEIVCRDHAPSTEARRECTLARLRELMEDERFALSDAAKTVLARLYSEEAELPAPAPVTPDRRMAYVLAAIDAALHAATADTLCTAGSPFERAMCRDGFAAFVRRLGTREVRRQTVGWRRNAACAENARDPDCFDDPEMNALIRDPERYLARLASRMVDRVDNVERGLERRGSHRAVTLAGAIYHLGAGEPRRGLEKDPSSVPDTRGTWWRVLSHALPYYVGFTTGGGMEAGYRPSYYVGGGAALVFPVLPVHFSPTRDATRDQLFAGYGLGMHFRVIGPLDVETSYQALRPYHNLAGPPVSTVETAVVAAEKLRVGFRYVVSDRAGVYPPARGLRKEGLSMTVGILDANGLIYWTGRLLAH